VDSLQSADEHINETLFLLEKFGVSDLFYHELSMLYPQLPRSYKVKECRRNISHNIDLVRLPSPFFGAYRPLKEFICLLLSDQMLIDDEIVRIKFSGDGASFSKSTSYVLLSLSFPSLCDDVLAGSGNHTFAAVKICEKYEELKSALEPVFEEINEVISNGTIRVNSTTVRLQCLLGSDLKFMLIVMGMNAAHSNYACLWCDIHKDHRWDMSILPGSFKERTLIEMKACVKERGSSAKGCINPPLIEIEPRNCVPDELHLFLRISDVILRTLFTELIRTDKSNKIAMSSERSLVQKSVKIITSFRINFSVWLTENSPNSRSCFEFTAINRNERLKVIKGLPQYFDELLSLQVAPSLAKLWMDFISIYEMICSVEPDAEIVEEQAKQWVTTMVYSVRKQNITIIIKRNHNQRQST
jgi:hypothetical protein